ncbi:MAG: hypothetical protein AAFN79_07625 [Pseudomonadota bacterium]
MGERRIDIIDMDAAAARYRASLYWMRLCQLYAFWMLLDLILRPLAALTQVAAYGGLLVYGAIADFDPGPMADLSKTLTYDRGALDVALLGLVWLIFAYISRLRANALIVALGVALTLFNLAVFHDDIYQPGAGFLEELRVAEIDGRTLRFDAEVTEARHIRFGIVALLHLQFLYIAFRGLRVARGVSAEERRDFPDYAPDEGYVAGTTRRLLQIPPAIRYARRRALTTGLLLIAGLANLVNYWLVLAVLSLAAASWAVFSYIAASFADAGPFAASLVSGALTALVFAIALSLGLWLRLLIRWAARGAERYMRRSLEDVQHLDRRPPILFLRSFLDDQVDLPPPRFDVEQWLFDGRSRRADLDRLLMREGTVAGPLVALGDPSDPAPPYGAARGYFDHADWQDAVARLCDEATAIVMALDRTEGVAWEVSHLTERDHAEKTLLLIGPKDAEAGREMLANAAEKVFGTPLPDAVASRAFAVRPASDGSLLVAVSKAPDVYAYALVSRAFLRDAAAGRIGKGLSRSASA